MSDSHGAKNKVNELIEKNYDFVIYLGDGLKDFGAYENLGNCFCIKGNCDIFAYDSPVSETLMISGKKIFATHGHEFRVKNGIETLYGCVNNKGYDIVCFGHTHNKFMQYINVILFINPGSVGSGDYAEIEITKAGEINGKLCSL